MIKENLSGTWKMTCVTTGEAMEATIPGSVMSTLLELGKIEDPYYRDNEKITLPIFEDDYEFSREFTISGDHMRMDAIDIVFYGLDTVADIYVNDVYIASTNDMHRTYRYSIREFVNLGVNRLRIYIHSPLKYISEYQPAEGKEVGVIACNSIKGSQYLRKSHSMFGWDWGPQLPDMGIFRTVELQSYSKTRIVDLKVSQEHKGDKVFVSIDPILEILDNIPIEITVSFGEQKPVTKVIRMLEPGQIYTKKDENKIQIEVNKPELWWPNGMGEQKLYDVNITVGKSGVVYDERQIKLGLRTIEVCRDKDEYGEDFAFIVNGRRMFAMGANYIPEDCVYSRITRKRQEYLVKSAAAANFNMLRVWGGGYYPSDDFYDLCDKYGLLVWQDLMFACNVYDLTDEFEENIVAEVKDNVRRLRHHACLALWCGNNEIESAWMEWDSFKNETPYLKADYIKMFEYLLPKAVKKCDSDTMYWPSSPCSGGSFDNPSDENRGDAHYWDVWHGQKPFSDYRKHYFRFCSEFGFQSFPGRKTVESFTLPEDRNIFSHVMESHQKNDQANGKILYYISENFLYPKDFNSLLYISQILQGMAIKFGVEHFRRNRGRCNGALFWQINDNWPVASWSSIDYCGRWKALQYMAKHFFEPVHGTVSIDLDENGNPKYSASTSVVNDGVLPAGVKVVQTLRHVNGKQIVSFEDSCHPLAGKVTRLRSHDYTNYIQRNDIRDMYLEVVFHFNDRSEQVQIETFVPYKHMKLEKPELSVVVSEDEDMFTVTVSTDTFTPFIMLDLKTADCIFEDNAFSLSAGKTKTVTVLKGSITGKKYANANEFRSDLEINYLQKSYMDIKDEFDLEKNVEIAKEGAISQTAQSFPTKQIALPPVIEDEYSKAIARVNEKRKAREKEAIRLKALEEEKELEEDKVDSAENSIEEYTSEEYEVEEHEEYSDDDYSEEYEEDYSEEDADGEFFDEDDFDEGDFDEEDLDEDDFGEEDFSEDGFDDEISEDDFEEQEEEVTYPSGRKPGPLNFITREDNAPVTFKKLDHAETIDESLFADGGPVFDDPDEKEEDNKSEENEIKEDALTKKSSKEKQSKDKKKSDKKLQDTLNMSGIFGKKSSEKKVSKVIPLDDSYDDIPSLADVEKARQQFGVSEPITPTIPDDFRTGNINAVREEANRPEVSDDTAFIDISKINSYANNQRREEPRKPSMAKMIQGLEAAAEQKVFEETGVLPELRKQGDLGNTQDVYYGEEYYGDGYPQDAYYDPNGFGNNGYPVNGYEEEYREPRVPQYIPREKQEKDIYKEAIKRLRKK